MVTNRNTDSANENIDTISYEFSYLECRCQYNI